MENILRDIPRVCVYLDDILVTRGTEADHLSTLNEVLGRLRRAGLRLKHCMCAFMMPTVEYLDTASLLKDSIQHERRSMLFVKTPAPQNVTQPMIFPGYGQLLWKILI